MTRPAAITTATLSDSPRSTSGRLLALNSRLLNNGFHWKSWVWNCWKPTALDNRQRYPGCGWSRDPVAKFVWHEVNKTNTNTTIKTYTHKTICLSSSIWVSLYPSLSFCLSLSVSHYVLDFLPISQSVNLFLTVPVSHSFKSLSPSLVFCYLSLSFCLSISPCLS